VVGCMETFLKDLFTKNWPRKLFSLLAAAFIWMIVSSSITTVRVFARVPIRIVNLPANKTIRGLMSNGILDKRMTLTITGAKDVLDQLGPQDFEVVLDVSDKGDEWIATVSKNNIVSLNPEVHLLHAIRHVSHTEMIIHLCPLVTRKIPVFVRPPQDEAPEGYQFLDVWPQRLYQTVSGPEDDVKKLQEEGLTLDFDLTQITADQLAALQAQGPNEDEVSFFVPDSWKRVKIPFLHSTPQPLNSLEARQLRIDFLHKALLPMDGPIPVRLFFPRATLSSLNPATLALQPNDMVKADRGVCTLTERLYVSEVSRLFLDLVRDRLEIVIVPAIKDQQTEFHWSVLLIDPKRLEEIYVTLALANELDTDTHIEEGSALEQYLAERERFFRTRFQNYVRRLQLYREKDVPLTLAITKDEIGHVFIGEPS
jgi:hypothetical protein